MILTYGSDCSGIEAPYIALCNILKNSNIELKHVFSCDIDLNVRHMINSNFDPLIVYDDVFNRNVNKMPYVDIYCAGFPCQTFSTVGKRSGFDDERGIVFFPILEYIQAKKPKICIFENVKGLITHNKGETFKTILDLINSLGIYHVKWDILSPHEHKWPQYRPRVFIVCIRLDTMTSSFYFPPKTGLNILASELLDDHNIVKHPKLTKFEQKNLDEHKKNVKLKYGDNLDQKYYFFDIGASPNFGLPRFEVVPCLKASRSNYYISKLGRKLTISEIEKIQGFPKLSQSVSDTQYRKMLGNSMCIPVLEDIFTNVLESIGVGLVPQKYN